MKLNPLLSHSHREVPRPTRQSDVPATDEFEHVLAGADGKITHVVRSLVRVGAGAAERPGFVARGVMRQIVTNSSEKRAPTTADNLVLLISTTGDAVDVQAFPLNQFAKDSLRDVCAALEHALALGGLRLKRFSVAEINPEESLHVQLRRWEGARQLLDGSYMEVLG